MAGLIVSERKWVLSLVSQKDPSCGVSTIHCFMIP